MQETERMEKLLKRVYDGEPWHGPSVKDMLTGITPEMAAATPIPGAHSIWEIVLHMTCWKKVVNQRLFALLLVEPKPEENWPIVPEINKSTWNRSLLEMDYAQRKLCESLLGLSDSRLGDRVPGKKYNNYFMLHGLIQHDLYHAGQMALMKKMVTATP